MTFGRDLIALTGGPYTVDLKVVTDPRFGHLNDPAMLLRVMTNPGDPELQDNAMETYLLPHQIGTLLGLLKAGSPTGSVDLPFPEETPNWWVRLTRREPDETLPELELRRVAPDSGVTEREAVGFTQADADHLHARIEEIFALYSDQLTRQQLEDDTSG